MLKAAIRYQNHEGVGTVGGAGGDGGVGTVGGGATGIEGVKVAVSSGEEILCGSTTKAVKIYCCCEPIKLSFTSISFEYSAGTFMVVFFSVKSVPSESVILVTKVTSGAYFWLLFLTLI